MDEKREREIMAAGAEAALYFKQLVRDGVPEKCAAEMAAAWILGTIRLRDDEPKREPWEPLDDGG